MKRPAVATSAAAASLVWLTCLASRGAEVLGQATDPIGKVIALLDRMVETKKVESQELEVFQANASAFCEVTSREKKEDIVEAGDKIELLGGTLGRLESDLAENADTIQKNHNMAAEAEGDIKAARALRTRNNADYEELRKDYAESIDALKRAIDVLRQRAASKVPDPDSLAQVSKIARLPLVPGGVKSALSAFLQQPGQDSDMATAPTDGASYTFQSFDIVGILEKLLDKFTTELTAVDKEETEQRNANDLNINSLTHLKAGATRTIESEEEVKANKLQTKAESQQEKTLVETGKAADEAWLKDFDVECASQALKHKERKKLLGEQMESVTQAIGVLHEVTQQAGRLHRVGLLSPLGSTAFVQLMSRGAGGHGGQSASAGGGPPAERQRRVAQLLTAKAALFHSKLLSSIALHVAADPFAKVKDLINKLIQRLLADVNADTEQEGFCNKELPANKILREERASDVESLEIEIESNNAQTQQLNEEIADLNTKSAHLQAELSNASALRLEEKDANSRMIQDGKEVVAALDQASKMLAAESFGDVLELLKVIEMQYTKQVAQTEVDESQAATSHGTLESETTVLKVQIDKDIEHRTKTVTGLVSALPNLVATLASTQTELKAAQEYFEKLKTSCLGEGNKEELARRREEEIQSLREALTILNGEVS